MVTTDRNRRRLEILSNGDPTPAEPDLPTDEELRERFADNSAPCSLCGRELAPEDFTTQRCEEIGESFYIAPCPGDSCRNVYEPEFGWRYDEA